MTRSVVVLALAVGLSLAAIGGVLARFQWERSSNTHDSTDVAGVGRLIYALDPRDDRAMASYATDIFVGKILSQTGAIGAPTSAPGQELPQSQFGVEVVHTVKGQAEGVVTINQVGGLDAQTGKMILLDGDALLHPGRSELFLVVHVPEQAWYQIAAAGHGHLTADDPIDRAALIDRFKEALEPSATERPSSSNRSSGEHS